MRDDGSGHGSSVAGQSPQPPQAPGSLSGHQQPPWTAASSPPVCFYWFTFLTGCWAELPSSGATWGSRAKARKAAAITVMMGKWEWLFQAVRLILSLNGCWATAWTFNTFNPNHTIWIELRKKRECEMDIMKITGVEGIEVTKEHRRMTWLVAQHVLST